MPLKSMLFRGDAKLEAASKVASAHVMLGARGEHVAKIQLAVARISGEPLAIDGQYGPKTAAAVLAFKKRWKVINPSYQHQADNIVGVMTMDLLDRLMAEMESGKSEDKVVSCGCKVHRR